MRTVGLKIKQKEKKAEIKKDKAPEKQEEKKAEGK